MNRHATALILIMALTTLSMGVGCRHLDRGVGAGIRRGAAPLPVVMFSTHGTVTPQIPIADGLAIGPSWRMKVGGYGFDSIFGVEGKLKLDLPTQLWLRGGVDALILGCTWSWCHSGAMGLHGGVEAEVYTTESARWVLGVEWDRDVRFGTASDNTLMVVWRWYPTE